MQKERKRVYVWEFPVRFTHWINVLSIIALSITGFYIGSPFIHAIREHQYVMGWMRFVHFVSAYTFLFSVIVRIYWMFMGNRYASWKVLLPVSGRQWRDLWNGLRFYLFLRKSPPYSAGHTATAALSYLFVFAFFVFEIISGFALYAQGNPGGAVQVLGGWLSGMLHIQTIRLLHHLVMYVILVFAAVHVYIGWFMDAKERNGLMGSIFGGFKFVTGKEWE